MKKFLALIFIISFGSCTFAFSQSPMDEMFKSWYGTKIKYAIKNWGNPTDIEYDQSQTKYIWKETSARYIPGTQFQKRVECERMLIVDTTGLIVFGKYKGEGCPFTSESVKKWNNPKN